MAQPITTQEVRQLLEEGATLVDVLPASTFAEERIPGAVNIPMPEIRTAADMLDKSKPVITSCYDRQCDLSSRAAAVLEDLGFTDVYDYVDSKIAWLADGLPSEGRVDDSKRAVGRLHRDLPTVGPDAVLRDVDAQDWEIVAVTTDENVVLGVVRREAYGVAPDTPVVNAMQPATPTVRPSIPLRELAETMDKNGEAYLLVTTHDGKLLGLVRRADLDAA